MSVQKRSDLGICIPKKACHILEKLYLIYKLKIKIFSARRIDMNKSMYFLFLSIENHS